METSCIEDASTVSKYHPKSWKIARMELSQFCSSTRTTASLLPEVGHASLLSKHRGYKCTSFKMEKVSRLFPT